MHRPCFDDSARLFYAAVCGSICGVYTTLALYYILYLWNTSNYKQINCLYMRCICIKLSVVRSWAWSEVECGQKGSDHVELSDHAELPLDITYRIKRHSGEGKMWKIWGYLEGSIKTYERSKIPMLYNIVSNDICQELGAIFQATN